MKIAMMTDSSSSGQPKNREHCVFVDKEEAAILICAMADYCRQNKRRKKAASMLKQFDNQLMIFG